MSAYFAGIPGVWQSRCYPHAPMDTRVKPEPGLVPLRWLNLYRVVVAGLFFVLVVTGEDLRLLGLHAPDLFYWTTVGYLLFGVISSFTIHFKQPMPLLQLYGQLLVDIVAITLLVYASGGARSGLGGLLFVPVAAGSLLAPRRSAILFAAVATLAVLGAEVYAQLTGIIPAGAYTQAGILGMILFTTAVLGFLVAHRARESEALAAQRGVDLANLAQLNDYIIQHLQTGIIAVDADGRVRMLNATAASFLGVTERQERRRHLHELSPALQRCLERWQEHPWDDPPSLPGAEPGTVLIPHFNRIGEGRGAGVLVFLEDSRMVAERMQSMKLAALGRLTASIAHEIRNPLSAVSHAGQLLGEAERLGGEEQRLTEIIRTHTGRVNTIIENVLQLSRRQQTRPEMLKLGPWLDGFIEELGGEVVRECQSDLTVRMDPSHLQQVLSNLCDNARRHGGGIELRAGTLPGGRAYLDVLDSGPGVAPEFVEHIFEPFYSASAKGTGLGLFIARELCECNQARLSYLPRDEGGSRFRISFADAKRWVT